MNNISMPFLFPGEHLLSSLARWFDIQGRNDFLMTCKPYFPNINQLNPSVIWRPVYAELLSHYIDTYGVDRIINEHTLLPFYRYFLSEQDAANLNEQGYLLSGGKVQVGMQTHVKSAYHWRWCNECVQADCDQYGTTYWHACHQIPSIQRCYKHQTPLISGCKHCGFEYKHFQRHCLPPEDDRCIECEHQLLPRSLALYPESYWLDAISLALYQNPLRLSIEDFRGLMRAKLGYKELPRNLSVAQRLDVSSMQTNFEQSLNDAVFDIYFKRSRGDIFSVGQKVLNIVTFAYRDARIPPISILLMLKSLKLDDDISRLVMDFRDES
ncbi:TniQ family protein [Pseudoalteromonas gelatinilytica]